MDNGDNGLMAAALPCERLSLDANVACLPGIGPKRLELLRALDIATLRDLLFYLPRAYQDRRQITPIAAAQDGVEITVEAEIVRARNIRLRGRNSMALIHLRDATGEMTATFFGRGFMANTAFRPGARGLFTGRTGNYKGPCLKNPEYELLSGDQEDALNTGRIVPVYRLTEGVTQRMLRRWVRQALDCLAEVGETLPPDLLAAHGLPPIDVALRRAHFPDELAEGEAARSRFAYEELLAIQVGVLRDRAARAHAEKGWRHVVDGPHLAAVRQALPFQLTGAQARVVDELLRDMASPRPMRRLVQGDVGCGKTVVALHAIAAAADGGFQTAVMAPTEILAEQHLIHLRAMLAPVGLRVELLTGSMRGIKAARARIASGDADVVVGTQALIQESTVFHRLGLVVIDEQHRFGVLQRSALSEKGLYPDILQMSATPIPRTLAITVYGAMDVSVIEELPPGRMPVKTRKVTPAKTAELYQYVREQAGKGLQTYIICPLIEESERREDLTPLFRHYEELSAGSFQGVRCALIHGRLDAMEKDQTMRAFKNGYIDVLFSTSVIEVGIDAPKATTMIIEDAGQFGLTQLHQLRGRVGRGADQSHCFLLGEARTPEAKKRLEILCTSADGFQIAEADLEMRGPGEFYGVRQAGLSDLRVADLIRDVRLLDRARRDAHALLAADPALTAPEHQEIARAAARFAGLTA